MRTQLQAARGGVVTPEMEVVAGSEKVSSEEVREAVASGALVIPANRIHLGNGLRPVGIGRLLTTKVNANFGTSSERSSLEIELKKLEAALEAGADCVMDLSTGGDLDLIRRTMIANCPVPFGTVPIYEVIQDRDVEDVTVDIILEVIEKQARQGVDFFTIHCGLLREHLPLVENRVAGIVSRGGALLAKWMLAHNKQNPLYEHFDQICDIMIEYDVSFSLGDGLRPGAIADATDQAQLAELRTLGELVLRSREKGCQVMVEGPGHVPFDQIQYNMEIQKEYCHDAPFYVLGPLVTDLAPGYDHITSAIGGTAAATYGASFLCYVTPTEHLGLPDAEDVRTGVVASKIAAHAGDIARGHAGAKDADRELSLARSDLNWEKHIGLALDSKTAEAIYKRASPQSSCADSSETEYCTMCGENWCSLRVNKELRKTALTTELAKNTEDL